MTTVPVSVIIPFYNGHDYIARAISSIENQTLLPAEIIVVDDGSSQPFVATFASVASVAVSTNVPESARIPLRIVTHTTNRGIPSARNSGVAAASQPWVAFLDQDDEWQPHKLRAQWDAVENTGENADDTVFYGAAYRPLRDDRNDSLIAWPRRAVARRLDRSPRDALRTLMLRGNAIPFITVLCATSTVHRAGGFDEELRGGSDDYALLLRCAATGIPFHAVALRTPLARRHETGANHSNALRFLADDIRSLQRLACDFPEARRLLPASLAAAHYRAGRGLLDSDPNGARPHLRAALRLRPLYPRAAMCAIAAHAPVRARNAFTGVWDRFRGWWY